MDSHGSDARLPRSILFYTHALAGGGAERVVATLASGLAQRGHRVTLATDYAVADLEALIDPAVQRLDLGRAHAGAILRLARWLRRERPDMSISALGVSNLKHALAATLAGRGRHAVLSFHGYVDNEPGRLSYLGNSLAPLLARLTARCVFVSDDVKRAFCARGVPMAVALRIYNPVATPMAASPAPASGTILGVGRLVPLKGFATLLDAVARLGRPDRRLVILGEGPERAALMAQAAQLGLADRLELPGWVADPAPFYARAACFVCASRHESFGNVLVEALAHGVPVVATDCGGPREILDDGRFGALVPVGDADAMAMAISAAMANPGDPTPRRARAAAFTPAAALDAYEALIEAVASEASGKDRPPPRAS
jgi:glycosyltransferase involved in cell wall biosynthesis